MTDGVAVQKVSSVEIRRFSITRLKLEGVYPLSFHLSVEIRRFSITRLKHVILRIFRQRDIGLKLEDSRLRD